MNAPLIPRKMLDDNCSPAWHVEQESPEVILKICHERLDSVRIPRTEHAVHLSLAGRIELLILKARDCGAFTLLKT